MVVSDSKINDFMSIEPQLDYDSIIVDKNLKFECKSEQYYKSMAYLFDYNPRTNDLNVDRLSLMSEPVKTIRQLLPFAILTFEKQSSAYNLYSSMKRKLDLSFCLNKTLIDDFYENYSIEKPEESKKETSNDVKFHVKFDDCIYERSKKNIKNEKKTSTGLFKHLNRSVKNKHGFFFKSSEQTKQSVFDVIEDKLRDFFNKENPKTIQEANFLFNEYKEKVGYDEKTSNTQKSLSKRFSHLCPNQQATISSKNFTRIAKQFNFADDGTNRLNNAQKVAEQEVYVPLADNQVAFDQSTQEFEFLDKLDLGDDIMSSIDNETISLICDNLNDLDPNNNYITLSSNEGLKTPPSISAPKWIPIGTTDQNNYEEAFSRKIPLESLQKELRDPRREFIVEKLDARLRNFLDKLINNGKSDYLQSQIINEYCTKLKHHLNRFFNPKILDLYKLIVVNIELIDDKNSHKHYETFISELKISLLNYIDEFLSDGTIKSLIKLKDGLKNKDFNKTKHLLFNNLKRIKYLNNVEEFVDRQFVQLLEEIASNDNMKAAKSSKTSPKAEFKKAIDDISNKIIEYKKKKSKRRSRSLNRDYNIKRRSRSRQRSVSKQRSFSRSPPRSRRTLSRRLDSSASSTRSSSSKLKLKTSERKRESKSRSKSRSPPGLMDLMRSPSIYDHGSSNMSLCSTATVENQCNCLKLACNICNLGFKPLNQIPIINGNISMFHSNQSHTDRQRFLIQPPIVYDRSSNDHI